MALPYLQISSRFIRTDAQFIAAVLRVPRQQVVGMAADLFAFTVERTSTETTPPDGVFLDPDATSILEAASGWTGEPGKMVEAFIRAGVLEKLEIGIRVRGCNRYRATWEKNRRPNAKTRATVSGPDGPSPGQAVKTHVGPEKARPVDVDGEGDGSTTTPKEVVRRPKATSAQAQFVEWADTERARHLGDEALPDKRPKQVWKGVADAIAHSGVPTLKRAYLIFLADGYAAGCDPPFPMTLFAAQWADWVSKAKKAEPQEPTSSAPPCSIPDCGKPSRCVVWDQPVCFAHVEAAQAVREAG